MDLIIETDIGRDADDFFALCYLAQVKDVNIRAVTITPGDTDQIAVAKFLLKQFNIDAPVGIPKIRGKKSVTPFHHEIMHAYGETKYESEADGNGCDIIHDTLEVFPDAHLFCIGPVSNVGQYLQKAGEKQKLTTATMQGGFCSYDVYRPEISLDKFNGMKTCPTFNLNGDVEAGKLFSGHAGLNRSFIGKNVCHAVVFNNDKYLQLVKRWCGDIIGVAFGGEIKELFADPKIPKPMQVFLTAAYTYFRKHPEKKFHDPTAAVAMLHPEIATWVKGTLYRERGGWGTNPNTVGDNVAVELDHEMIWKHIIEGD
jgi:inosine-uridine nucleoside N-ribohydrolase